MHPAIRFMILAAITCRLFAQQFAVRDTSGAVHTPLDWRGHPAIVLFFVAPECPLSNAYVAEMNRIQAAYATRGVLVYAIQADITVSPALGTSYARDFHYEFPMLLDSGQALVRLAGATVTPQAAVLSSGG